MAKKLIQTNEQLVKAALARSLWHAGPGAGHASESAQDAFSKDRIEMNKLAERVLMFLERQGVSLHSMDS